MIAPRCALALCIAFAPVPLAAAQDQQPPAPTIEQAEAALAAGKADQAKKLFERLDRGDPRVLLGMARADLALDRADDAVNALLEANKLKADDFTLTLALADALLAQGRRKHADEDFQAGDYALMDAKRIAEQAAALDATSALPWLTAGRAARELGDNASALPALEKAATLDPSNVDALLELGVLRYGAAAACKSDAAAFKPALARARETYEAALKVDPKCGAARNGLGWLAWLEDDKPKAIEEFGASLQLDPLLADSYRNLFELLGADREAKESLLEVLDSVVLAARSYRKTELRPKAAATALYWRGILNARLRKLDEMKKDLDEAAKLDKELATPSRFQQAIALHLDGQYKPAAVALLQLDKDDHEGLSACVAGDPSPAEMMQNLRGLGDQIARSTDLPKARDVFKLVAHLDGANSNDWNNYAFFCRETAKYEESYAAYEKALELNPIDPSLLNDTALILQYHLKRDLDHALELYARAVEEGNRVLADPAADSFAKEAAATAVRDATNNSAMLRSGKGGQGGP